MQSQKHSLVDTTHDSWTLTCSEEEAEDGSLVFHFDGSDSDMSEIVRVGMLQAIKQDKLEVADYLAPNFDELPEEEQIQNYFFAFTVKEGLTNLLKDTADEQQMKLF